MPSQQERLNIAVFIDFDNIEIGVKNTLHQTFDVGVVLDGIKEKGEIVSKIAYADWTRAGDYSRNLSQHAVRLVQRNLTPGGDKNGADINMALDALEMAFTHQHINAYVIVGGDSDFLSLVEKLKQYDKKVFIVGGRAFTSQILQKNCHEFIAYENLHGVRRAAQRDARSSPPPPSLAAQPLSTAFTLVRRALKILGEREVSPQTGLLKSTLLQLDSTFSERNYGSSSFLDFTEKLSQAGLVLLKTSGRSVMVELNPEYGDGQVPEPPPPAQEGDVAQAYKPADSGAAAEHSTPAPEATSTNAEGVAHVGEILKNASNPRWPMYIRNVKQIIRAADATFDERRYGFGGLMDLLRACQRDGLLRLERDRRGGLRVFPGAALQKAASESASSRPMDVADDEQQPMDNGSGIAPMIPVDVADSDSQPIDPTAELLGRAKSRRPRAKAHPPTPAPTAKKKKTAAAPAKRGSRSKKSASSDDDNAGNR